MLTRGLCRVSTTVLLILLTSGGATRAADVTLLTPTEGDYRLRFEGGAFPYVLWLHQHTRERDGQRVVAGRGLGLRGPWWEQPYLGNAWYMNNFLEIRIDGQRLFHNPDQWPTTPLADRCQVLETGKRALVEFVWKRKDAAVRLRGLVRPDCRPLLVEVLVEAPGAPKSLVIDAVCFPAHYTKNHEGQRQLRTAKRQVGSPATVQVDPREEPWLLLCDTRFDKGKPEFRRSPFTNNGCAGLHVLPDGVAEVETILTGYPVTVRVHAKPGITRLRLAFDELPLANDEAERTLRESSAHVQEVLRTETFAPGALTDFTLADQRRRIADLPEPRGMLAELLRDADAAVTRYRQAETEPIRHEQQALEAIDRYRRALLTAERRAVPGISVFEMRGPGYSHYRTKEAVARLSGATRTGGYLHVGGQGRSITPVPGTVEELYRHDVVLMLDVDTRALGKGQLRLLRQYVEDGGALAVFGGFYSYGASNIAETPLADLLPLRVRGRPFDLRRAETQPLKRMPADSCLQELTWPDDLVSPWCHELTASPEAHVVIAVGDAPWWAVNSPGLGRVAACAGTLMGAAPDGRTAFSQWADWPEALARLMRWLSRK